MTRTRKGSRSRPDVARLAPQGLTLRRDEELDVRRPDQHLAYFVFEQAIFVGDALAQMLEFETRLDHVGLLETAELSHVFENAPGEGAVPLPLLAEFVDGAEEAIPILGVDPVVDLDQDRTAIVRNVPDRLGAPPVQRRRQVDSLAMLQFPRPG